MADDPTHPRHRQTVQNTDPVVISNPDGTVWRVNWPHPGLVTIEYSNGSKEELTREDFEARMLPPS